MNCSPLVRLPEKMRYGASSTRKKGIRYDASGNCET